MRRVRVTVLAGLVAIATGVAIVLSGSPVAVAGGNGPVKAALESASTRVAACQSGEVVPAGTSAVRLHVFASLGPLVDVRLMRNGTVIARGQTGPGWTGHVVTVPFAKQARTLTGVTLCFDIHVNGYETIEFSGAAAKGQRAAHFPGGQLPGFVSVEYLRPSKTSWWSLLTPTARRMGLGHAGTGTWGVLLILVLMAGVVAVSVRVLGRELA